MITFFPNNQWALPAASSVTPSNLQWACQPNGPPGVLQNTDNTFMGSDGTITIPSSSYYDVTLCYTQSEFGYTGTAPGVFNVMYYPPGSSTGYIIATCPITGSSGSSTSTCNEQYLQQTGVVKVSVSMPVAYTAPFTVPCTKNYISLQANRSSKSIMSRQYCQSGSVPQPIRNAIELHIYGTITTGFKVTFPLTVDGTVNGRALFSSIIPPTVTAILTNAATLPINIT